MIDEFDIHSKKRSNRTYVSPAIDQRNIGSKEIRKIRIVSKVIDSPEEHTFAKIKDELVIRVTDGNRHEIIAKFYEDTRGVFTLTFQKYTKDTGMPHKASFSFINNEIPKIVEFINKIPEIKLVTNRPFKIEDTDLTAAVT